MNLWLKIYLISVHWFHEFFQCALHFRIPHFIIVLSDKNSIASIVICNDKHGIFIWKAWYIILELITSHDTPTNIETDPSWALSPAGNPFLGLLRASDLKDKMKLPRLLRYQKFWKHFIRIRKHLNNGPWYAIIRICRPPPPSVLFYFHERCAQCWL